MQFLIHSSHNAIDAYAARLLELQPDLNVFVAVQIAVSRLQEQRDRTRLAVATPRPAAAHAGVTGRR